MFVIFCFIKSYLFCNFNARWQNSSYDGKIFMKLANEKSDSVKKQVITTITGKIYLFIDKMNKLVVKYFLTICA